MQMTRRLDKIKTDKLRGPNLKLVTNGPEAQNENEHGSLNKIRHLQVVKSLSIAYWGTMVA